MISQQDRWIFVHIQKTGGTSIRRGLGVEESDTHKHRFARELRQVYGSRVWDSCFKFAFVRNPWDRLVSWWCEIERSRIKFEQGAKLNKFKTYIMTNARSFDDFLLCDRDIEDSDGRKCVYRNQIDYLTDESGLIIIDFVGRFERLAEDLSAICSEIGRDQIALPYLNKSPRAHYTEYYTAETAELVGRLYSNDVQRFGYRYGD